MGSSIINTGLIAKDYLYLQMSGDQVPVLNEHLAFDVGTGNLPISIGGGQASGLVTLYANRRYILEGTCGGAGNGGGAQYVQLQWYDVTNNVALGNVGFVASLTYTTGDPSSQPIAKAVVLPTTNIQVELRVVGTSNFSILYGNTTANDTYAFIESIDAFISTVSTNANPPGSVIMFGGITAPSGYLMCDGSEISRTTYSALFAAIGTSFGVGDTSTTFNIPDMQAASPAGVGVSTGYTTNEVIALGSKYDDQLQGFAVVNTNFGLVVGSGFAGGVGSYNAGANTYDVVNGGWGTPRFGNVTKGKTVGMNFVIKY